MTTRQKILEDLQEIAPACLPARLGCPTPACVADQVEHGPRPTPAARLMPQHQRDALSLHGAPYHRGDRSALRTWTWMSSDADEPAAGTLEPWLR